MICIHNFTDENSIANEEENHEKLTPNKQLNKLEIVFGTNAIVNPFTMMIEIIDASIASVTME